MYYFIYKYKFIYIYTSTLTKHMLNTNFKNLTIENKLFAIHRIAFKTNCAKEIVKKVLLRYNPLMDIQKNRIVIHRNSYHKLLREIYKENLLS